MDGGHIQFIKINELRLKFLNFSPTSASKTLAVPNLAAGTYTVTCTATAGSCTTPSTTTVQVNQTADCAVYISATDGSTETYSFAPANNGVVKPLTLSVVDENENGTAFWGVNAGITYQWTGPNGFTSNIATPSVSKPGLYSLKMLSGTSQCAAKVSLSGEPCQTVKAMYCNPASAVKAPEETTRLNFLDVGDNVFAGDFIANILTAEPTGDGKFSGTAAVSVPYLKGIALETQFTNVDFNQCLSLKNGTDNKLVTVFDPEGRGILDVDKFIEDLGNLVDNIKYWSDQFTNVSADYDKIPTYAYGLKELREQIVYDSEYSDADKQEILNSIDEEIELFNGILKSVGYGSLRSMSNAEVKQNIRNGAAKIESKVWEPLLKLFCNQANPTPFTIDEKTGIVPQCIWKDAYYFKNDKAFASGLIDGFYINISDQLGSMKQVLDCITALAKSINPLASSDLRPCRDIAKQMYEPLKMMQSLATDDKARSAAWEGIKKEVAKYGDILTCSGTYADDPALCYYMRGRLLGDFVADYATGVASVKLLQGVKKLAKVTNFTVALKTIAAVENGFAAMSNVVNKLPNAVLKKVGTRANITAKLLVNGTTELLSYTQKVIKVPAANWLTNTSGWTYISSIAGEYIDQAGKRVKGYLKIYETTCLIGNSIVANPSARVEASATKKKCFGVSGTNGADFVLQTLKLISKVPKAYKQWGKCNFFADALKAKMKEVDIQGEHIHIKSRYDFMPSKS